MKKIYLAASYSRRLELCEYRKQLNELGYTVQARWLDGKHQISDNGMPLGDNGESLIEASDNEGNNALRAKFANDDVEDVMSADMVINFTEPPRSGASRGGRHVECGIAIALGKKVIVVGYRENLFHWLTCIEFHETWEGVYEKFLKENIVKGVPA
jgi:nucleoside 2-deoxyribosyltransferase